MRCARCGNENPEGNRFCGMCGATLLSAPAAAVVSVPAQAAATQSMTPPSPAPPAPAPPRTPPAPRGSASNGAPVISGPSFLGLNDPPPRKRASLSIDPHSAPSSSNLDYLLQDEEEPRRGGGAKFILIVLALALAVGMGYLRWKNQGLGWLGSTKSKPSAAATQDLDGTDTSSTASASSPSAPANPAVAQPAKEKETTAPAASPVAGGATTNPVPATTPVTTSANTPANTAPAAAPASTDAGPSSGATDSPSDSPAAAAPASKQPAATAPDTTPAPTPKPIKTEAERPAKPPAAIKPARPADPVSEAQKYIYGRGVTQDCERGMRLLRPAAAQANPKAMIEMGALYSAGLCTPHDLPTAYRWFALALRKDPDNASVQTDLQKLWGEMTQPERQLAIKLSQ